MPKISVLVVDDDRPIAEVLSYNLSKAGYDVSVAHDGQDGLNQARLRLPDVIILDLMLPVVDGLEVCKRLRSDPATRDMFILMCTAKSEEFDELIGFVHGADDYVTKPFSIKVVLERIKALSRRRAEPGNSVQKVLTAHGICLDKTRHKTIIDEALVDLTKSEFLLLEALMRQPGRAFTRSELISTALGEDTVVLERTIDVHVRALRRKLDVKAVCIETVRGVGYRFRDTPMEV
jgi:two-component system phosphate regulon response regulator PhoB